MCTKMNKIQRNVTFVFQGNEHLKKNIIKTCRENATVSANFTNSSIDVSSLVNNLHVSIINYEVVYKSQISAIAAAGYVQENDNETYFVNRQFRRGQQQYRDREREKNDKYFQTFKSFKKKNASFAIAKIVDQSITFNRSEMMQINVLMIDIPTSEHELIIREN